MSGVGNETDKKIEIESNTRLDDRENRGCEIYGEQVYYVRE